MKYFLSFFLVCLLSCSPGSDAEKNPVRAKETKITAFLDTIIADWEGQDALVAGYRDLTGLDLEILQPPHQQYMEKLLIQLSSKKLPDICEILPEYLPVFVENGQAVRMDWLLDQGVHIKSIDPEYLEMVRYRDGHIYGLQTRAGGGNIGYIRKDWLEKLGMQLPENWEELLALMRAFTWDDPDGNGKDDTYAYTDVASGSRDWYNRLVMLDARVEIYFDETGENGGRWIDGFSRNSIIPALKRYRQLYVEGLVDPEFITNTTYSARVRLLDGQVGIFTYWANHWARILPERLKGADHPGADLIPLPAIDNAYYISRVGPLLIIIDGDKDPRFVFNNFIDIQYDKAAGQTLFTYGVQGVHWDYTDGEMRFLPNPQDPYHTHFTKSYVPPVSVMNGWELPMPLDSRIAEAKRILDQSSRQERLKSGGQYYNRYFMEIEQGLKPEIMLKVITGAVSAEAGQAEYMRRAQAMGLKEILEELNGTVK